MNRLIYILLALLSHVPSAYSQDIMELKLTPIVLPSDSSLNNYNETIKIDQWGIWINYKSGPVITYRFTSNKMLTLAYLNSNKKIYSSHMSYENYEQFDITILKQQEIREPYKGISGYDGPHDRPWIAEIEYEVLTHYFEKNEIIHKIIHSDYDIIFGETVKVIEQWSTQ